MIIKLGEDKEKSFSCDVIYSKPFLVGFKQNLNTTYLKQTSALLSYCNNFLSEEILCLRK